MVKNKNPSPSTSWEREFEDNFGMLTFMKVKAINRHLKEFIREEKNKSVRETLEEVKKEIGVILSVFKDIQTKEPIRKRLFIYFKNKLSSLNPEGDD